MPPDDLELRSLVFALAEAYREENRLELSVRVMRDQLESDRKLLHQTRESRTELLTSLCALLGAKKRDA